jgi:DNA-binding CsgD family transcriptional regulator
MSQETKEAVTPPFAASVPFDQLLARLEKKQSLSRREAQVVNAAARGLHTKATAAELGCSPKTVDELWRRVYRKLRCDSRLSVLALLLSAVIAEPDVAERTKPEALSMQVRVRR